MTILYWLLQRLVAHRDTRRPSSAARTSELLVILGLCTPGPTLHLWYFGLVHRSLWAIIASIVATIGVIWALCLIVTASRQQQTNIP